MNRINSQIDSEDYVMSFGKHRDETILHILKSDASYILWLSDNTDLKFSKRILDHANDLADDQYITWLADNYEDTGENDDWGGRD